MKKIWEKIHIQNFYNFTDNLFGFNFDNRMFKKKIQENLNVHI